MKVCRSTHPMDNSVYCILVTHYYIVGSGRAAIRPHSEEGTRIANLPWPCPGSRVALHIFPDCGFRQGIEANPVPDRKSTRLNSSHLVISYAVFCLKKKKTKPYAAHNSQT